MSHNTAWLLGVIFGFLLGIDCCMFALETGTLTVERYASCADVPPSVHFDGCTGKIKGDTK